MNLYLISQNVANGWDTYDSAVVIAESEDAARRIYPGAKYSRDAEEMMEHSKAFFAEPVTPYDAWAKFPTLIDVELLGSTSLPGPAIVCASFNAG